MGRSFAILLIIFAFNIYCNAEGVQPASPNSNNKTEVKQPAEPIFQSFFESNCSYKTKAQLKTLNCEEIQFTRNYQVEVLLPIFSKIAKEEIYVPFLIKANQKKTTFSRKALKMIGASEGENVLMVNKSLPVVVGEENILGLDFIDDCQIAMDFFDFEVGMAVNGKNGSIHAINWPLDSFKDEGLETKASEVKKKHAKLKQKFGKMTGRHTDRLKKLKEKSQEKENQIKTLTKKLAQLKEKRGNVVQNEEPEEPEEMEEVDEKEDDDDDDDEDEKEENEEKERKKEKKEKKEKKKQEKKVEDEKKEVPKKNVTKKAN